MLSGKLGKNREADLLNITIGIALMAAFGGLLFAVRARESELSRNLGDDV